ncbi:3-methyl-2-oxobutanoate hydroxymethyltransferase [Syntrophobotulus glycolicus]|nr:3-methyl-2-oxobutanoate hydroxymethyltransferase [Syntrophobotulus glycolicus]
MKKTILDFWKMSRQQEKITMVTAYDYSSAGLVEKAGADMILVGDSLGMVVLGYESTVPVSMEEMLHHAKAARRGAHDTFVVVDLPFMSYATIEDAMHNAARLVKEGGADAVKMEGGEEIREMAAALVKAGIPIVGHIGLTPQTITKLGGFKVQGKDYDSARRIFHDARALEEAGVFMLVLEAIPAKLAGKITEAIDIPTIGIGASNECSGQVLVYHDLLGLYDKFVPKFVKQYDTLGIKAVEALKRYCADVRTGVFPAEEHSYKIDEEIMNRIDKELK